MNNKGFFNLIFPFLRGRSLVWKILIIILLVILVIPITVYFFPIAKYVIMIIIGFIIFGMVGQAFGNNILTFIIVGILLYFLLVKYFYVTSAMFLIYFFLMYGFMSVIIWGTARFGK